MTVGYIAIEPATLRSGSAKVSETKYYPYGVTQEGGSDKYLYTGKELDKGTGLYYYEARYYNPNVGRFVQPDMIIPDVYNPQAINRYSYVLNNPLRYVDPSGHFTGVEEVGVGLFAIMAISAVLDWTLSIFDYVVNKQVLNDPTASFEAKSKAEFNLRMLYLSEEIEKGIWGPLGLGPLFGAIVPGDEIIRWTGKGIVRLQGKDMNMQTWMENPMLNNWLVMTFTGGPCDYCTPAPKPNCDNCVIKADNSENSNDVRAYACFSEKKGCTTIDLQDYEGLVDSKEFNNADYYAVQINSYTYVISRGSTSDSWDIDRMTTFKAWELGWEFDKSTGTYNPPSSE